jgi:hypothetical protein
MHNSRQYEKEGDVAWSIYYLGLQFIFIVFTLWFLAGCQKFNYITAAWIAIKLSSGISQTVHAQ